MTAGVEAQFPTVSDPSAMRDFPHARDCERDALLDLVRLEPGSTVLDLQAAGGYLSDEIHRRLDGDVTCVCIEPCAQLRARLNTAYRAAADEVEHFASVASASVDVALGLAGLHHSRSHAATVAEVHRVLAPGGWFAVCDVVVDSAIACWLDEFVDRHSAAGHRGNFVLLGEITRLLDEAGFSDVHEQVRCVPWKFGSRAEISIFFRGLFGLDCGTETIDAALDDFFRIDHAGGEVTLDWRLVYARGRKPAAGGGQ